MNWVEAFDCLTYGIGLHELFAGAGFCASNAQYWFGNDRLWFRFWNWSLLRDIVTYTWGPILAAMILLFVVGIVARVSRSA